MCVCPVRTVTDLQINIDKNEKHRITKGKTAVRRSIFWIKALAENVKRGIYFWYARYIKKKILFFALSRRSWRSRLRYKASANKKR